MAKWLVFPQMTQKSLLTAGLAGAVFLGQSLAMCPVSWHLKQLIVLLGVLVFEVKMGDSTEVSAADDFNSFSIVRAN